MRNLKRVLSLGLASVMLMGMMVVGAGAASKDFTDASEIKNVEAVDVMVALGVLQGGDKGDFQPNSILTREQAAKIICYMLLGPDNAEKLATSGAVFSDVAANRWSAPYIAYCVNLGILAGDGNGNFFPEGKLTGAAFAKMLLVALGYDAAIEQYVGDSWTINVATGALDAGILPEGLVLANELSRQDAAQMAFQTLTATMVGYTNKGTSVDLGNGVVINTGASKAETLTWKGTEGKNYTTGAASVAGETVQFCEKYFSKLVKNSDTENGRTGHYYTLSGKTISDFAADDTILATSTNGTTYAKLTTKGQSGYIGYSADTTVTYYVNGDQTAAGTAKPNAANIGTEVNFIDTDNNGKYDAVTFTTYTFSKVTATAPEKADGTEAKVTITGMNSGTAVEESKIKGDFAGLAKDDYVMFAEIKTADGSAVDYYAVYEPTTVTGKMTKYSTANNTMTIDGTVYTASAASVGSTGLTQAQSFTGTDESTFYVDVNGYVVAVDGINAAKKYAVVDSIAYVSGSGVEGSGYVEARLVFTDGTTQIVNVATGVDKYFVTPGTDLSGYNTAASGGGSGATFTTGAFTVYANSGSDQTTAINLFGVSASASANSAVTGSIYTYTVSNDKYTLTDEGTVTAGSATFTKGVPTIGTLGGVANNNTTYVVKTKNGDDSVWTAYTGYQNVPTMKTGTINADYATTTADGMVFVYVDATAATNIGDSTYDVAFFFDNKYTVDNTDPDNSLYEYTAILNGELTTVVATSDLAVRANTLYKVTLNDKGQITAKAAAGNADYTKVTANGDPAAKNGVLAIDSVSINGAARTALTYNDNTVVYLVNTTDDTVSTGTMESVKDDAVIYVKTVDKTTDAGKIAISVAYVLVTE